MKDQFIIIAFCLTSLVLEAAPDDRFHGGGGDGSASAVYSSYTFPVGGEFTRYTGGGFDGSGSATYRGWTAPIAGQETRYLGGGFDGSASETYRSWTPATGGQFARFLGSGFDGHASSVVESQPNPLSGDTDGDGVPDWWESFHYRSLVLADAHTDVDQDGRGSYHEYLWDTDPNDILSRFEILSLSYGDSVEVTFSSSSPNRYYRLESSTDLKAANWTTVNDSPVIGNSGDLEITGPWNNNPKGFFRIQVSTD